MRSKGERHLVAAEPADGACPRERIRADLERRGVPAEISATLAQRLTVLAPRLSPRELSAVVAGAAAACDVRREGAASDDGREADVEQIQRLMRGFAGELRKLEEGLRILSAYVSRMHDRASRDEERTLH